MKAIIIDDEPLAHKVILEYAKNIPFLDIIGQCYLATEAYALLNEKQVDLIFLDINMPTLKGLDFLRTLSHRPQVIITSAYSEFALEGYELQICDYLLKPFAFDRFLKAVNKAHQQLYLLNQDSAPSVPATEPGIPEQISSHKTNEQIFVKVDKRYIQLNLSEVHYLESYGNYVKIWLADNFHLTPRTLSSFEQELPDEEFARIHKSYILQKAYVDYVEGNMVVLKSGKQLMIGKNYRKAVKSWFG